MGGAGGAGGAGGGKKGDMYVRPMRPRAADYLLRRDGRRRAGVGGYVSPLFACCLQETAKPAGERGHDQGREAAGSCPRKRGRHGPQNRGHVTPRGAHLATVAAEQPRADAAVHLRAYMSPFCSAAPAGGRANALLSRHTLHAKSAAKKTVIQNSVR